MYAIDPRCVWARAVPMVLALAASVPLTGTVAMALEQDQPARVKDERSPTDASRADAGASSPQHQHPPAKPKPHPQGHATHEMDMTGPLDIGLARDGSGTSWLPDVTPMYALHHQVGAWGLMLHGNAFLQYIDESGPRGDEQLGSVHWLMGMARREVGGGPSPRASC